MIETDGGELGVLDREAAAMRLRTRGVVEWRLELAT
jgi:hypothetical protein